LLLWFEVITPSHRQEVLRIILHPATLGLLIKSRYHVSDYRANTAEIVRMDNFRYFDTRYGLSRNISNLDDLSLSGSPT
jgi:hypothetical protein